MKRYTLKRIRQIIEGIDFDNDSDISSFTEALYDENIDLS